MSKEDLILNLIKVNKWYNYIRMVGIKMEYSAIEEYMLLNIDININSDYFIDILRSNYVRYHNIQYVSDLIGELYIHHIIHKDGFGFNFYTIGT